jgi:uncharacterized membrane protein YeaQ/YmgE (transglycosylase-associated protein family)
MAEGPTRVLREVAQHRDAVESLHHHVATRCFDDPRDGEPVAADVPHHVGFAGGVEPRPVATEDQAFVVSEDVGSATFREKWARLVHYCHVVYHDLVRFFIIGSVSGWIAAIGVRGRIVPRGCAPYIVLGLIGAFAGGFLFRTLGLPAVARVLAAALGAVMTLLLGRALRGNL